MDPSVSDIPVFPAPAVNARVLPFQVALASPSNVLAVPLPVISLLSALLLIVVPEAEAKDKAPLPSVCRT